MIWMYLNTDIYGASSRNLYGQRGDKVAIIGNNIEMLLVLHESGHKFHIQKELLSNEFIKKEPIKQPIKENETKKKKRI